MSNRKLRTAKSDALYMLARGEGVAREMLFVLEKDGFLLRGRTKARDPQGHWKGDRRRNTTWTITDKGWAVLMRRGGSNDQRIRMHRSLHGYAYWNAHMWFNPRVARNVPVHELISDVMQFPQPGEITKLRSTARQSRAY